MALLTWRMALAARRLKQTPQATSPTPSASAEKGSAAVTQLNRQEKEGHKEKEERLEKEERFETEASSDECIMGWRLAE